MDICYTPDDRGKSKRVIGDFVPGVNAPQDVKDRVPASFAINFVHVKIIGSSNMELGTIIDILRRIKRRLISVGA